MEEQSNNQPSGKQLPKIADLLSAPLVAAASANSIMMKEQTRFLLDTCFVSRGDNLLEPLMIEMTLSKSVVSENNEKDINIENISASFKIPLLTLIPINSLAIDNVDIDFSMEIVSYTETQSSRNQENEDSSAESASKNNTGSYEPALTGKLSYDSNDKGVNRSHNASKLNVKMHARTIPLPQGVATIIELYTKSINAIPKQNE